VYPAAPGQQVLQIEPFQYRDNAGAWTTASWKPIAIKVSTQVTEADVNELRLRDITDIEKYPAVPSLWDWLPWLGAGLAAAALLTFGIRKWQQRYRAGPSLSP